MMSDDDGCGLASLVNRKLSLSPFLSFRSSPLPQLRGGPAVSSQPVCGAEERGCFHQKKEKGFLN